MKIFDFLKEANGQFSSTRLFAFCISMSFVGDYITHIAHQTSFDPSVTIVGVVLGSIGLKVAQKPFEDKPDNLAKG